MSPVDMSPEAVTERLRQASRMRHQCGPDMSAKAITHRIREVSQLRVLCLKLEAIGCANGLGDARKR